MKNVPTTNVLIALKNILEYKQKTLPSVIDHKNNNRINSVGDLLEYYVKDAFCEASIGLENTDDKLKKYQQTFSYLGNSNNPPDFIVRHGVAVEVKKIEGKAFSPIALNSSFPKDYLYNSDIRINSACRECEDEFGGWIRKDMIYAIGNVSGNRIHSLWFIYGDCFCADKSVYEKVANKIKEGVLSIPGVEFAHTKELGRVNKVDPLGITYLRIRGMWGIEHPSAVFKPYINHDPNHTNIYVLMKKETYDNIEQKPNLQEHIDSGILKCEIVQIPNPNNPAKNIDAILFTAIL
ncbi:NgoPII family restriction endonuclease [Geobacillus sp. PK12]|uniref:NgoPII family restriction endonuclease n=1 Tax=Geobacillus sp. PK12 TaxID=2508525 RepID=UPI001011B6B0|nr:NgoPII family restriction endonuclease [Geobacillus sp. PK12]RXS86513.1 NgoPII family restriction endonuclease [Geobacillus sp. PK12]